MIGIFSRLNAKQKLVLGLVMILGVGVLVVFVCFYFIGTSEESHQTYYTGGVVANGYECAKIGGDILRKGGSAADAAIAAMFCEGVAMPQSCGLGGGFVMTYYQRNSSKVSTLIARERAPAAADENMFSENQTLSTEGGLAIAVPGELKGYWALHEKFGVLPWEDLVQPTIDLCKTGIYVTDYLEGLFNLTENYIRSHWSLSDIFINPINNQTYKKGEKVKRLQLAKFLEDVAKNGPDVLYDGKYTEEFIQEIRDYGGIITKDDLKGYKVEWENPNVALLPNNNKVYSSPLPATGVVLTLMLNILNGYLDPANTNPALNWHRIIESFKFAYAKRTELGDPKFIDLSDIMANLTSIEFAKSLRQKIFDNMTFDDPSYYGANMTAAEDHGTANICVLAPNGDAIAITSTINLYFGSHRRSNITGIILNNEMDDFSTPNQTNSFDIPPSPNNYIMPGKIPLSSMAPSIVVDETSKNVRMVVGGAGGSKITSSIALVIIQHLLYNKTIQESVTAPRVHHQLFPMVASVEKYFDRDLITKLEELGHKIEVVEDKGFSALTALSMINGMVSGATDYRRSGSIDLL